VKEFGPEGDVSLAERHDPQHPGGAIFREPIVIANVPRLVPGWTKPIVIGPPRVRRPVQRHGHGGSGEEADAQLHARGRLTAIELDVYDFPAGLLRCDVQPRSSIREFWRRASLRYGLETRHAGVHSTKNTILKRYDGRFKDLFEEVYDAKFKADFERRASLRASPDR